MFADHKPLARFARFLGPIVSLMLVVAVFASPATGVRADREVRGANSNQGKSTSNVYIVRMSEEPVVAYTGGVAGLKATKPARGQKINPNDPNVVRYVSHLTSRHDAALNAVGGGRKLYDYSYSFNGFAAELTAAQATKLAATPGVLSVSQDEAGQLDTSSTPDFLGLTATGGLWEQLGGVGSAGENVIIGIVDTGIWPEHPSFSDRTGTGPNGQDGKLAYQQIPGWHGKCVPGENFTAANCNQKLIGAQYFNAGYGGNAGIDAQSPWDYNSPRDFDGHGTHTASTAGGNAYVPATGAASAFGSISGIAPRARIAAYKVCWAGGCFNSDSVAAIDQAVADGVDVINFSISGTQTNFMHPVEVAFLFAADAGVFVAASAGNSGPTVSTVAHPSPWLTTVAAGTHNRVVQGSVTLGNDVTYTGASVATASASGPLIDSVNAGLANAKASEVELCYPGTLDPAKVTGKVVLCKRGVIARVDKSLAVQQAEGIGMVLYDNPDLSLNADFHFVPTVHVNKAAGLEIKAYAETPGATATINKATLANNAPAPFTASFSSRGPLQAGGGDLLKPDLIAPGQDILAAVAPPGNSDRLFDLYSGTSMSSPHVAGLGALLKDLHPEWSPMAIKSALMTSGYDVLDNVDGVAKIFRQGAGHVQPNSAANPGLVFDAGWNDWLGFLKGQGLCCGSSPLKAMDASDLNVPSIAVGDMAGTQTVTRKVTNVSGAPGTFTATVTGMAGVDVKVSPNSLTLVPGASAEFKVTFTRTDAAPNVYAGGQMTWTSGAYNVRIPLVVKPVALAAPAQVSGDGSSINYNVRFGYTGPFTAATRGLIAATTTAGTVVDDPNDSFVKDGPGTKKFDVEVPAGTSYARFSLFDDFTDGNDDLDLYVYNAAGKQVGGSGSGTSAEEVNLLAPAAGTYTVYVHGWQTDGPDAQFTLFHWLLGTASAGNMTVTAPSDATLGQTGKISLDFTGLTPKTKYLGSVAYEGSAGMPNPTIVRVDTP